MLRRIKIEKKTSVLFLAIIKIEKRKCVILSNNNKKKSKCAILSMKIIIYEARFEVRQYIFLVSAVSEFF